MSEFLKPPDRGNPVSVSYVVNTPLGERCPVCGGLRGKKHIVGYIEERQDRYGNLIDNATSRIVRTCVNCDADSTERGEVIERL
tara:strand:- start:405 stop:656 length:252 start_codon:yes stop_codon:yes gene_type:complete